MLRGLKLSVGMALRRSFDGLAQGVGDLVRHVLAHHHGPTAEVDGGDVLGHALEVRLGQHGAAVPHALEPAQHGAVDGQVAEAVVDGCSVPSS